MSSDKKTKILVVGGGFGGLETVNTLEKQFSNDDNIEITLVDRNNYLIFTSMLAEVVASSIEPQHCVVPLRECLNKASFKELEVKNIDLDNKKVECFHYHSNESFILDYDFLVLALGSKSGFHGVPGAEEYTFPLKNLADAMVLRSHVIDMFESADLEFEESTKRKLLTFVVIGGGYTGIEVAAELNDFIDSSRRYYRNISSEKVKVVVVDPGDRIMHEMSESLAEYGLQLLKKRGMEFRLNTRVSKVTTHGLEFEGGDLIETCTPIWAAGTSPQSVIAKLPCADKRGRIEVNEYFEVDGYPGVWAIGDCAQIKDPESDKPYPPTAQLAIREGHRLGENITSQINGNGTGKKPFIFKTIGMLAPLGHHSAVAEIKGIKFSGFFAWFMWRMIYLGKLPGFDRKIRVSLDWFLDIFLSRDIIQLKFLMKSKDPE
ncbi:MAG: NAD(P)/FAD-dependent oxidoreductase [Thermodesulfobacteriota bacterium]